MQSLFFSLAGVSFSLVAAKPAPPLALPVEYLPFTGGAVERCPFDSVYDVSDLDPVAAPAVPHWSWTNEMWRMGRTEDGRCRIEIRDPRRGNWLGAALLADDFGSGLLYARRSGTGTAAVTMPFHHPHDRAIIMGRFAFIGGGVVHSSCVLAGGKAFLFVGRSGAGKTTMARLWRDEGATILNDERNIVRMTANGPQAGSSPWHGEENQVSPGTAPLAAIFYLNQSPTNTVREIAGVESIPRLFTTTFVPVFLKDGPRLVLNAWADILETVPSFDLSFTPDRRAVAACRSAVPGL